MSLNTIKAGMTTIMLAISISSYADNNQMSFTNNSPYTLALNKVQADGNNTCLDSALHSAACATILLPGQTQNLQIMNGSGINLNYFINTLTDSNYNLNIQHQSEKFSFNATSIPDTTTSISNNLISYQANSLPAQPVFNVKQYSSLSFIGVNLSGTEAGSNFLPTYLPSAVDAQYFVNKGMNTVRVPINWNFLTASADINNPAKANQDYLISVYSSVKQLLNSGVNVVLDLHNYMRFAPNQPAGNGDVVSDKQVNAVWTLLSTQFTDLAKIYDGKQKSNQLIFEIMNEPSQMETVAALNNDNAGIKAIRDAHLTNLILIEGNFWSGLHSWNSEKDDQGVSNAQEFVPANINDPLNNYAITVHEYFDGNGSGTSAACQDPDSFKNYLAMNDFLKWMQQNQAKVFISEFGSGLPNQKNDPAHDNCVADVNYLLEQVLANAYNDKTKSGFIGWTVWVAGHGWSKDNFNNVAPDPATHQETLQMQYIYSPAIANMKLTEQPNKQIKS